MMKPGMKFSGGAPVPQLEPPLRWAADIVIDGPQLGQSATVGGSAASLAIKAKAQSGTGPAEYERATDGSVFNDQALPTGTVVFVGGETGRGTYRAFKRNAFGANEHTIRFDNGTTKTLRLREQRSWRALLQ